ncbi:hypothetical protein COOONC_07951 [Cooperia oncophora]
MSEICEELSGGKFASPDIRYEAERDFARERRRYTLEEKVKRTLSKPSPPNTHQKNIVKKLPTGWKYSCNALEVGTKMKVLCVYYE